jgi:hypothetical protein
MTVQGIGRMQQLQSSPHQHDCLMGTLGPLDEAVDEVVEGGIIAVVGSQVWLYRVHGQRRNIYGESGSTYD